MTKVCSFCGASYPDANVFCPADGTTLRAADADGDLIGSVVADRYLVTDLLGEGGMGKVYRARHVRLPQEAAIKVLHPGLVQDAGAVARLKAEASNASRISHDRVARVFDFGETADGTVYLAMEYVPGRTLKRILADGGPLEPRRAAGFVRQMGEGLDAAHRLGIVHRDLKPDNVMVVDDGDGVERVKIVDFGIAKALTADGDAAQTRTGFVVGTPEFMSPEQLVGSPVDARSDVYALALVAYQCLTGALPFDTSSVEQTISARLTTAPSPLAAAAPGVAWPESVQAAFDAALARTVEQRPSTAGAFARQLATAVDAWLAPGAAPTATPEATPAARPGASPPIVPADSPPAVRTLAPPLATPPSAPPPLEPARAPRTSGGSTRVRTGLAVAGGAAVIAVVTWLALGGRPEAASTTTSDTSAVARSAAPAAAASPDSLPALARPAAPPTVPTTAAGAPSNPPAAAPGAAPDSVPARVATSATPPALPTPAPESVPATGGDAARVLDSLTQALSPDVATPDDARAAVPALRALLPRLRTATDTVWAEIRMADAYLLMQDADRACEALSRVRGRARTTGQRETVQRYIATLGCVP